MHPEDKKANICDLCGGEPKCVEMCTEAGYNALTIVNEGPSIHRKLHSRNPVETAKDLAVKMFGDQYRGAGADGDQPPRRVRRQCDGQ